MSTVRRNPFLESDARVRLQAAGLVALSLYVLWLVLAYRYHLLDGVNLLIHEAGHVVFSPFGEVLTALGGTLLQIAMPLAFLAHFHRARAPIAAAVMGVWTAESLMNVARYMGDAIAQQLPLVGGTVHDWHWLLSRWGIVRHAETLGGVLHTVAAVAAVAFVVRAWGVLSGDRATEVGRISQADEAPATPAGLSLSEALGAAWVPEPDAPVHEVPTMASTRPRRPTRRSVLI